jgi:hypothetical protein
LREAWVAELRQVTLRLFDRYGASGDAAACHPERLANAHRGLERQLHGPLEKAAGIATPDAPARRKQHGAAATPQPVQEA